MYVCILYLYASFCDWRRGLDDKRHEKRAYFFPFQLFRRFDYQEACQKKQELAWIKILFLLNQFYFEILKNKEFLGENSEKNEMLKDNG